MERAKRESVCSWLFCCDPLSNGARICAHAGSSQAPYTWHCFWCKALAPSLSLCCSLHHVFKFLLIWCQHYFLHASQIRIWSCSTREEFSAPGCCLPQQWFKTDTSFSKPPCFPSKIWDPFKKDLKFTVHHICILTPTHCRQRPQSINLSRMMLWQSSLIAKNCNCFQSNIIFFP